MKQTKTLAIIAMAGALLATSCASKKELQNCQTENKELTGNYQAAKEQLAASQARVTTLEDQLAQMKKDYSSMQTALDKSLNNANQNNISIEKLVDQINESNQYIRRGEEQERLTQHGAYQQPDPLIEQGRVEGSRRTGTQGCGLHLFGRQYALSEWKL